MGNQSSRPSPEQDVSKNEPKQPSSASSVSGNAGAAAAASQDKKPSTLSDDSIVRKVAPFLTADEKQALASTSLHYTGFGVQWYENVR